MQNINYIRKIIGLKLSSPTYQSAKFSKESTSFKNSPESITGYDNNITKYKQPDVKKEDLYFSSAVENVKNAFAIIKCCTLILIMP